MNLNIVYHHVMTWTWILCITMWWHELEYCVSPCDDMNLNIDVSPCDDMNLNIVYCVHEHHVMTWTWILCITMWWHELEYCVSPCDDMNLNIVYHMWWHELEYCVSPCDDITWTWILCITMWWHELEYCVSPCDDMNLNIVYHHVMTWTWILCITMMTWLEYCELEYLCITMWWHELEYCVSPCDDMNLNIVYHHVMTWTWILCITMWWHELEYCVSPCDDVNLNIL